MEGMLKQLGGGTSLSSLQSIINQPNQDDVRADSLSAIAGGFQASDPLSAILKGVTGGLALTKKGKAQAARDIQNQKLQELVDYETAQKKRQAAIEDAAMAHVEATQTGMQLAQALEQAQLGDEDGIKNWLASSPGTQKVLQGRIGVPVEGAKVANINGVDVIQAYGKGPDGNVVMDPNPVPVDSYLKAYAPDAYANRAAQRLEQTAGKLKNDNLAADLATEQARAKALNEPAPAVGATETTTNADGTVTPKTPETTQMKNDNFKIEAAAKALHGGLDAYEKLVQQYGVEALPGKGKDALNTARRSVQLQMKELFNLGVLNGPDLDLMDSMLVDSTVKGSDGLSGAISGAYDAVATDVPGRVKANVKQLKDQFNGILQSRGLAPVQDLKSKYGLE